MVRRLVVVGLLLLAIGTAFASGSFSVVVEPLAGYAEANFEQQVATVEGWTIYAGSGLAVSTQDGFEKLQPYVLSCRTLDVVLAFAEWCIETRAVLIGDGQYVRAFMSIVW